MTHKDVYLECNKFIDTLRNSLKSIFAVNALVQLVDLSIKENEPSIESVLTQGVVTYQFQFNNQRGFLIFSSDLGYWLVSELLGAPAPDQSSVLMRYCYQLLVKDLFAASKQFCDAYLVDTQSIWVHPQFDQFYPMNVTIQKSRTESIQAWLFVPKGDYK